MLIRIITIKILQKELNKTKNIPVTTQRLHLTPDYTVLMNVYFENFMDISSNCLISFMSTKFLINNWPIKKSDKKKLLIFGNIGYTINL